MPSSSLPRPLSLALLIAASTLTSSLLISCSQPQPPKALATAEATAPVSITQNDTSFILSNGYSTATISKRNGDLTSVVFRGKELMGYISGHHAGYWEQSPANAKATITIDPSFNGGDRAEISIKGALGGGGGARGGGGGGANATPSMSLEIRFTMAKGDHGLYTYAIFSHAPNTTPGSVSESRFGAKLNSTVFDWLSVDSQRNEKMPTGRDWDQGIELNLKEARRLTTGEFKGKAEHKYDYCSVLFDTPAFGWSSTHDHLGLYMINPSMEFLGSGPTHAELTCHLDDGDGADPTILDYWRGTHYGGSDCNIPAEQAWSKVIGPIMIYLNDGGSPTDLFKDANVQAAKEAKKWPYNWVNGVDYPHAEERGTVTGKIALHDSQSGAHMSHLLVGLTSPEDVTTADADLLPAGQGILGQVPPGTPTSAPAPRVRGAGVRQGNRGTTRPAGPAAPGAPAPAASRALRNPDDWQHDAKNYQFWVRANDDGSFTIPNVRPGNYTLHAIADGVLGEFAKTNITVSPANTRELGTLAWTPIRMGRQLWDIGIPDRKSTEFLGGPNHWHWGAFLEYPKLFPNDIHYTIGKSDFTKDWFIEQTPHNENPNDTIEAGDGTTEGRATPWTIDFNIDSPLHGKATLRAAICAAGTNSHVDVSLNGKPIGLIGPLLYNATINRDGAEGAWSEHDVSFDASLLHPGKNSLTLTVPPGQMTTGVQYDYLRLELDENTLAPAP